MDKKALRAQIREKKRAMTPEQIEQASQRLGELFVQTSQYRQAKTIYGYLPYIQEVRTVPMLVQALILAYGIPKLLQDSGIPFKWPYLVIPAIIVCGLNSAAYVAEVIRSGLQAVDAGQMEAARTLGMSKSLAMRIIVIPQAFKIVLPSFGNEFITLLKETSVLSYVGVVEVLRKGTLWNAATFNTFQAYIGVALVYLLLTIPLSKLIKHLEKRMATDGDASAAKRKARKRKYAKKHGEVAA